MKTSNTLHTLRQWQEKRIDLYLGAVLVGLITGFVVVLYRLFLNHALTARIQIYEFLKDSPIYYAVGWFFILILVGILLGKMIQTAPMIKGSGIPQVKAVLLRQFSFDCLKELPLKFLGSILAIGCGLSLGREGPSVQLGAEIGSGVSKFSKKNHLEKYLVTSGASAGLAAAFNAPLAGVIFALEELHKNFSPVLLTCVMGASLAADYVSRHFFGLSPVFDFKVQQFLPLQYYPYIILLGIITGIFGALFNRAILKFQDLYKTMKKVPITYQPIIPLLIAGILGFVLPQVTGGGHSLIEELSHMDFTLSILILLIVMKFLFTVTCYGSGVPGGIFLPLLVIGALIGKIYASLIMHILPLDSIYVINFIVLGMAAYFTAIVRAPITGSVLILEMVGSLDHLLSLVVVCMTAFLVTELIHSAPIYDLLLEQMLGSHTPHSSGNKDKKVTMTIPVCIGSILEHKQIQEIDWPQDCLIVGIERGEKEIIPNGKTTLHSGDILIFLTDHNTSMQLEPKLFEMGTEMS